MLLRYALKSEKKQMKWNPVIKEIAASASPPAFHSTHDNHHLTSSTSLKQETIPMLSPTPQQQLPQTSPVLSPLLNYLLPNSQVATWLFNRTPSSTSPLAATPPALNSAIGFECRWPVVDRDNNQNWVSSSDACDLIICHALINSGIALTTFFGRRTALMYAEALSTVETLTTSLETEARRAAIWINGEKLNIVQFCWMKDGSLIVIGKMVALNGSSWDGPKVEGRFKGEMWYFERPPKVGVANAEQMGTPNRVSTFTEVPLQTSTTSCGLCKGTGCILCLPTCEPHQLPQQQQEHHHQLLPQDQFGSDLQQGRQHQQNPQQPYVHSWDDIARAIQNIHFAGKLQAYYTRNIVSHNSQPGGSPTVANVPHPQDARNLARGYSLRLSFICRSANPGTVGKLKQFYISKVWPADIGLHNNVKVWNNLTPEAFNPTVSSVSPSTPAPYLTMNTDYSYPQESTTANDAIVQEIKGLIDQRTNQQPFTTPAVAAPSPLQQMQVPIPTSSPGQSTLSNSPPASHTHRSSSPRSDGSSSYTLKVGDRDHRCTLCNKSFVKKSNAVRHRLTVHDKLRPFKCNICKQAFGHRTHLTRHQSTKHGMIISKTKRGGASSSRRQVGATSTSAAGAISAMSTQGATQNLCEHSDEGDKISCTLCDLSFSQRSNLNRHIRSTHQRKRIRCLICYQDFGQMYDLQRHFRRKHPECDEPRRYSLVVVKGAEEPPGSGGVTPSSSIPALDAPLLSRYGLSSPTNMFRSTSSHQQTLPAPHDIVTQVTQCMTQGSLSLNAFLNQNAPASNASVTDMLTDNLPDHNPPNTSDASLTSNSAPGTHPFSCA